MWKLPDSKEGIQPGRDRYNGDVGVGRDDGDDMFLLSMCGRQHREQHRGEGEQAAEVNIRNILFNVIIIIIIFINKVLLGVLTGDLGLGQRKKGEMWIYIEIYICLMFFISRDLRAW